jgi:serine protease
VARFIGVAVQTRSAARTISSSVICALLAWQAPLVAAGGEHNPVAHEPSTARTAGTTTSLGVIVKLRPDGAGTALMKLESGADRIHTLAKRTGLSLTFKREISASMVANSVALDGATADEVLARLRSDPAVEYVARDHRRFPHVTQPNDPLFGGQWYLKDTEVSAVDAINAWDRELGRNGVVIAVVDTGVLYDHPDLGRADRGGKLLPGYDFVSAAHMTNDGNGRDADPSDPGDWVNATDRADPAYANCDLSSSSWHGTRVAGMIGALTNNSSGVAGLNWNSYLLPVRVLGKCGGVDSDILAGLRWAAGLSVPGVPLNPTPARIVNASFGSSDACEPTYQEVIAELAARKVLLVISAGNEGTVVSSPANCAGVAAVAAIRHAGSKVGFSSLGAEVTIAAPGGNCVNIDGGPCLFSLDTTSNSGSERPATHVFTDQLNSNLGTSFSAPIVSGIAALMVSRNGNLSTGQLLERLREGARPFPTSVAGEPDIPTCHVPVNAQDVQLAQCLCTTTTCGAGMIDAAGAVDAADRPIAAIALPASVAPGQEVALSASGSAAACNRSLASFAWTVIAPASNPPAISGAGSANASVLAPATGSITLRLTVTDDQNRMDMAEVTIEPDRASSAAPASAGNLACTPPVTSGPTPGVADPTPTPKPPANAGGGGGGSLGLMMLVVLSTMLALSRLAPARRRQP